MDASTSLVPPAPARPPTGDVLQALRDIHTPPSPSWWPPAIGWWLVFGLLLLAVVVATNYFAKWWLRRAPYRQALRELRELPQQLRSAAPTAPGPALDHLALMTEGVATILRRVTLLRAPETAAAPLVDALQQCGPQPATPLRQALERRFAPTIPIEATHDPATLCTYAAQWVREAARR